MEERRNGGNKTVRLVIAPLRKMRVAIVGCDESGGGDEGGQCRGGL